MCSGAEKAKEFAYQSFASGHKAKPPTELAGGGFGDSGAHTALKGSLH